jgi:hypothetical protein
MEYIYFSKYHQIPFNRKEDEFQCFYPYITWKDSSPMIHESNLLNERALF